MTSEIECPQCRDKNIVFNGLIKKEQGGYENSWECLNCNNRWKTAILKEEIRKFNG